MKKLVFLLIAMALLLPSCKTTEKEPAKKPDHIDAEANPTVWGVVSHKFRAEGCPTVIVVSTVMQEEPLLLIPKDKLPAELDKEGVGIQFEFRLLRMPNPEGCTVGNVAEITNITKAKQE